MFGCNVWVVTVTASMSKSAFPIPEEEEGREGCGKGA